MHVLEDGLIRGQRYAEVGGDIFETFHGAFELVNQIRIFLRDQLVLVERLSSDKISRKRYVRNMVTL